VARVLGVGIATLDIINEVDGYPPEDTEVRAVGQRLALGGNTVNTLTVLSLLGHHCTFAGVLAADLMAKRVSRKLQHYKIDLTPCYIAPKGTTPTSYICLNLRNGSRTIVHYRDLPEFRYSAFMKIDLSAYDWLHFEGRNVDQTRFMLDRAMKMCPKLPISLEIEKPRPGIESLFDGPNLLLFSRHFARSRGFDDPVAFLHKLGGTLKSAQLVCAWGEMGAYAITLEGRDYHSQAYPPPKVVDTIGAGDVFNAGIIDRCVDGVDLGQALDAATRLASRKCGLRGFDGLRGRTP
jgi:ketohexokinase